MRFGKKVNAEHLSFNLEVWNYDEAERKSSKGMAKMGSMMEGCGEQQQQAQPQVQNDLKE